MQLTRQLRFFGVFSIATGAMISSGIFILPGLAFAKVGPAVFLSYLLAGLLATTGVLCVAELATAMPKAGGDYFFISRSLGTAAGTISGLLSWLALTLKTAFAIFGIAEIIHILLLPLPLPVLGMAVTLVFVGLNLAGAKEAVRLQVALVVALVVISVGFVILGMPQVSVAQFDPFAPRGGNAILITVGFVFISYGGVLHVASVAEEVDNPGRTLPLGMLASIAVVTLLYALMLIVTVGVLDEESLRGSLTPIATAAGAFLGPVGFWTVLTASLLAFVTTANAGIMSASRYPLAMSRDGMLPAVLSKVGGPGGVPYTAIAATGLLIMASLLLPLEQLVKAASTVVIASFALANLSVIILRESRLQNYRPSFRVPLYPWLQFVAVVLFVLLIMDMGYQALLTTFGFIVLGFLAYLFYGRRQTQAEFALLSLIERVLNRRLTSHRLESELREILYERDQIAKDRFDHLVEAAPVLDLPADTDEQAAFDRIADELAERTGQDPAALHALLLEREAESSTAISEFAAVPHLILDGTEIFELLLVRSKAGLRFCEKHREVHAVFVLAGTPDQRNLHLRCLAAIAQVIQSPEFERRWLNARGADALRDTVLLSKRKRA